MGDGWWRGRALALVAAVAVAVGWMVVVWSLQPGSTLHDEVGHVVIAREVWHDPRYLLELWGRPLVTAFYAPLAWAGLGGARLLAVIGSVGALLLAVRVARGEVRQAWLVVVLLAFQPWFASLGHEALTLVPAMLGAIGVVASDRAGRYRLAALVAGALPLARHEMVVLAGLYGLVRLYRHDPVSTLLVAVPFVATNVLTAVLGGPLPLLAFFRSRPTDRYGSGGWLHFPAQLPGQVGWVVLGLALLGLVVAVTQRRWRLVGWAGWYGAYLITHLVLFRFGLFKSGGYVVFLLPLAPMLALLAAVGAEALGRRAAVVGAKVVGPQARGVAAVAVAVAVAVATVAAGVRGVGPQPPDRETAAVTTVVDQIRALGLGSRTIEARMGAAYLHLPRTLGSSNWYEWKPPYRPRHAAACDLYVWEHRYSPRLGAPLGGFASGWTRLAAVRGEGGALLAAAYERQPCPPRSAAAAPR